MVDVIRRPQSPEDEDQKKQDSTEEKPSIPVEAPHLYDAEKGFAATSADLKLKGNKRFGFIKDATKKQKIIGGVVAAVLIFGGAIGVYAINNNSKPKSQPAAPVAKKEEAPKSTTEASKLTGMQISPELNKRPVTGIMIENSPDARPQSGIKDAGIIFEAIAEGGITRFLVLHQESQPDYIGPVRSVRPYYVEMLLPYDASIVHAGGSADGLAKVRDSKAKDIDHGANGGAFRRVNDRYAPHNLYTSMAELDKVNSQRGFTTSNVKSLPRKAEKPGQPVTASQIDISMSGPLYNSHYDYDAATNTYKRSQAGKPHTDHRSGLQLTPKVVVALSMNYSQRGIYSVYNTTGSGKVTVFQDGQIQSGTWSRATDRDQFVLKDDAGNELALNAGQTWFALVKGPDSVSAKP